MGAREYDPVIGRFLQPDPITSFGANTQALNVYSYALNNLLSRIDPTGRFSLRKAVRGVFKATVSPVAYVVTHRQDVARFTSRVLDEVSGIKYVGGLLSTGLLAGTHFGYLYGASTGNWQTVGRAHAWRQGPGPHWGGAVTAISSTYRVCRWQLS